MLLFIYRENDEEVGIGEVDDRVRIVNILMNQYIYIQQYLNPKQYKYTFSSIYKIIADNSHSIDTA